MYKLTKYDTVLRLADDVHFPKADGNVDYAQYQAWLAAGNQPVPADPDDPSIAIAVQIADIEANTMVPRVTRESLLTFAQVLAQQQAAALTAAGAPTTATQLLTKNIAYMKVKAVDDQIGQLRAQISTSTTLTTT